MRLHGVVFADLETFGDRGHSPWSVDCNNLKVGASDTMDSMCAVILHEWLHWDNLSAPIAGPIRDWNCNRPMVVIPPNGYGPYNAHVLKLSGRVPTANVENYVWFGVEAFLQNKSFGKIFADPRLEDNMEAATAWDPPVSQTLAGQLCCHQW